MEPTEPEPDTVKATELEPDTAEAAATELEPDTAEATEWDPATEASATVEAATATSFRTMNMEPSSHIYFCISFAIQVSYPGSLGIVLGSVTAIPVFLLLFNKLIHFATHATVRIQVVNKMHQENMHMMNSFYPTNRVKNEPIVSSSVARSKRLRFLLWS